MRCSRFGFSLFFFPFLEILEAFIRKLAAEFSSSFYIKILGVYMKKKNPPKLSLLISKTQMILNVCPETNMAGS